MCMKACSFLCGQQPGAHLGPAHELLLVIGGLLLQAADALSDNTFHLASPSTAGDLPILTGK